VSGLAESTKAAGMQAPNGLQIERFGGGSVKAYPENLELVNPPRR
jgi:hypothetical protein